MHVTRSRTSRNQQVPCLTQNHHNCAGLITPPLLLSQLSNDPATQRYLVSTSLIISGFCTLLHVMQFKIPFTNKYYGSGIVSVCGVSSFCRHSPVFLWPFLPVLIENAESCLLCRRLSQL